MSDKFYECILCRTRNVNPVIVKRRREHLVQEHLEDALTMHKNRVDIKTCFISAAPSSTPNVSNRVFDSFIKYCFNWANITFNTNTFKITVDEIVSLPIACQGCVEAFNEIKQEFFSKLSDIDTFYFFAIENTVLQDKSPDIEKLIDIIKTGVEIYPYKYGFPFHTPLVPIEKLSNDNIFSLYKDELNKTPYLKCLARRHNKAYKLVCLKEAWDRGRFEDSFLFQLKSNRNCITIIWENVNPGRATFIFKFRIDELGIGLNKIKAFITNNNITNKRTELRGMIKNQKAYEILGCVGFIIHQSNDQFENEVLKALQLKLPK